MNFEVHFADFANGVVEPEANRDIFPGTYTLANINAWDAEGAPSPAIAQTFQAGRRPGLQHLNSNCDPGHRKS